MFFISGSGAKKKTWELGDFVVTAMWKTHHVMFLPAADKRYWYIKKNGETENIKTTLNELKQRFPLEDFKINFFQLYGLWIVLGTIILLVWRPWENL